MLLDKQSARELAEAVMWLEDGVGRLWNRTLGVFLGKAPVEEPQVDETERGTVLPLKRDRKH